MNQIILASWQSDFANQYLSDRKSISLLNAQPGTGKTIAALYTASQMINKGHSDSVLVITDRLILKEHWTTVKGISDIEFISSFNEKSYLKKKGS